MLASHHQGMDLSFKMADEISQNLMALRVLILYVLKMHGSQ